MFRRLRAVEHKKWTGWCTPRFARSNHAKLHKKLRMRTKHARKLSVFCHVEKSSKILFFRFPCWDIINAWMLLRKKCCLWARATVLSCYRIR